MKIEMTPIGYVRNQAKDLPRHWSLSDVEGRLVIDQKYQGGLKDIKPGQRIVVLFNFHKSPAYTPGYLIQSPAHHTHPMGVFSICSPRRPNPVGLSVLAVISVTENVICVKGLDMLDGTPILDIKPHIEEKQDCPSYRAGE
jgi:tRNA-Thr(GGU) m(6)t(6)A37 methyltransferase TsaA